MHPFRLRQRLFAWLAAFAMMLGALAPAASRVMASEGGGWIELCSASGTHRVLLDAATYAAYAEPGSEGDSGQRETGLEACPYCLAHAGSVGLPPQPALTLAPPRRGEHFPLLFYRAPQPLFAWTAARPRAPPSAS
jgi:hypothetical protein